MIKYRKALKHEVEIISELSAFSFAQYPLYRIIRNNFQDDDKYLQFLHTFLKVYTKSFIEYQPCFVGIIEKKIANLAMLQRPDKKKPGFTNYIANGGLKLLNYVNLPTLLSYINFLEKMSQACNKFESSNWHLSILVVDQSFQGKQFGSKMLRDCVIPYVKQNHGSTLTLTTNTEINSRFYSKNGFTNFDKSDLQWKGQNIENWSFGMCLL